MEKIIESYNVDELNLYAKSYYFIQGYAVGRNMINTIKALPLARALHDGQYRKGTVNINGKEVKLPYLIHVIRVCTTLINLDLKMPEHDLDILYASALLHDTLEDCMDKLPKGGREFIEDCNLDPEIYATIILLSKHSGATEEELSAYFNAIKYNWKALLIKLSDRGHNVETLATMKLEKIHKYIDETRNYIYPLCSYAKQNYPELTNGVTILKSKIVSLTEATETLLDKFSNVQNKWADKNNDTAV